MKEKEVATYPSILAWKIPWPEEPGGLHPTGLQRVGYNWVTNTPPVKYYPHFFTDKKIEVEREMELVFKPKYCPFITVYNFSKLFHANRIIYAEVLSGW